MVMLGGVHSVIVTSPALTTDPYSGQPDVEDWQNCRRRRLRGCSVLPDDGSEALGRQQMVTSKITVRAPGHPRVSARDRLEWGGVVWRVSAPPSRWSTGTPHTVIRAERVTG